MLEKPVGVVKAIAQSAWLQIPTLRIRSANRISLDRLLMKQFKSLEPGLTLDVGAKGSPYVDVIPHDQFLSLDIDPLKNPDICCDIHDIEWEDDYFDTVIAIEVLEHLKEPQRAVNQIRRILKSGGVTIVSTRFFYRYHPDPSDFYRFTWDSLRYLFREFSKVDVLHHGNRLQVGWELINAGGRSRALLNLFNPFISLCESKVTNFPLGFVVRAQK